MDWLDLLVVQGTLKSLLQYHSSKAPILQCSAFFTVQLSHPCMTNGKTIALTRRTFVGKPWACFFSAQNPSMASNLSQSECHYAYNQITRTSFSPLTFTSHSHICLFPLDLLDSFLLLVQGVYVTSQCLYISWSFWVGIQLSKVIVQFYSPISM